MKVNLDYFKENFFGYSKDRLPFSFAERKSLKSCEHCNGIGRISKEELTDYHRREYDIFWNDCAICNGQGRVIVTEIFVSIGDIPYKTGRPNNFHNLLFEKFIEPYTEEGAKDIENETKRKVFSFKFKDVVEY